MHIYSVHVFYCFSVLAVNYRGSSGFGQKFVKSLPGNCGTLDVNDIQVNNLQQYTFNALHHVQW